MITREDFKLIGDVARHCNLEKLSIAIEEAKTFDLTPLFCFGFINDVLNHWDKPEYSTLVNGGAYTDKLGKEQYNLGIKRLWVYYAYARYILINGYNDTANGIVKKEQNFSLPTPLKELTDYSNKYRNMGKKAYAGILNYLNDNVNSFPLFRDCAGCNDAKEGNGTHKLTGFKFSTVRK